MKRVKNHFREFVSLLEQLHKTYPAENIGWHLALATSDYPDLSLIPDKELVFALEKYQTERSLDMSNLVSEEYVSRIQEDAEHLFDKQPDEWEEEEL